jgi:hypothetical protein
VAGSQGTGYAIGDIVFPVGGTYTRRAQLRVDSLVFGTGIFSFTIVDSGDYSVLPPTGTGPFGTIGVEGGSGTGAGMNLIWCVGSVTVTNGGSGYITDPTATASGGTVISAAVLSVTIVPQTIDNPTCVCYYQQREVFAGSVNDPETLFMSKTGDYLNFGFSSPSRPDDSIVATLASQQVNSIKHVIPLQSLIALTSAGAWRIDSGQQGGPITPSTIEATPQAFNGCSDVPPLVIGRELLYVQSKGSIVRDLSFNFIENVYSGNDMTALANHLFFGHQITDWDYAEEPFKIIWAVRDDGTLLSFTFLKEQEVYAWAHHTTEGKFKNVCVIPEGNEDAVYVMVERYIQGAVQHYIERMASRDLHAIPEGVPNLHWTAGGQRVRARRRSPRTSRAPGSWTAGLQYPLTYPAATLTPNEETATLSIVAALIVAWRQRAT